MQNQGINDIGRCININKEVNSSKINKRKLDKYATKQELLYPGKMIEFMKKDQKPHTLDLANIDLIKSGSE